MRIGNHVKESLASLICLLSSLVPLSAMAGLEAIEGVPDKSITDILNDLISWVLGFGLALCVVLMIWGGLTYVASTGDEKRIESSKKTFHYAIYGIAIIGLSYAMIKVVNDVLTNS